jgi:hypothetical protein
VGLRPILRGDVSREWPDVPRANGKDVGHARDGLRSAAVRLG